MTAIRVLLVEDNEVYRSTLELLLPGRAGIEIVGSVADGGEAAAAAERLDGAQATAAVRARAPRAAIICLTAEATPEEREAVLAAGAVGFVEKGRPTEELVAAIESATGRGESTA
jgi:two-component system response regulator NreC